MTDLACMYVLLRLTGPLTASSFPKHTNTEYLDLSFNQITSVDWSALRPPKWTLLRSLNLEGNLLVDEDALRLSLPQVTQVNLRGNLLAGLLPEDAFDLGNPAVVDIQDNNFVCPYPEPADLNRLVVSKTFCVADLRDMFPVYIALALILVPNILMAVWEKYGER